MTAAQWPPAFFDHKAARYHLLAIARTRKKTHALPDTFWSIRPLSTGSNKAFVATLYGK
jgi:hypothetical protein